MILIFFTKIHPLSKTSQSYKYIATVNGASFTGLNFRGFRGLSEKHESFSYESFTLSVDIYWSLAMYHESITVKIHILHVDTAKV